MMAKCASTIGRSSLRVSSRAPIIADRPNPYTMRSTCYLQEVKQKKIHVYLPDWKKSYTPESESIAK